MVSTDACGAESFVNGVGPNGRGDGGGIRCLGTDETAFFFFHLGQAQGTDRHGRPVASCHACRRNESILAIFEVLCFGDVAALLLAIGGVVAHSRCAHRLFSRRKHQYLRQTSALPRLIARSDVFDALGLDRRALPRASTEPPAQSRPRNDG